MFLGNPKDSVGEDGGTLGKIRESPPPLKNLIIKALNFVSIEKCLNLFFRSCTFFKWDKNASQHQ